MAKAEPPWWPEAVRLKDSMPLTALAAHLGIPLPALAGAFRERGVARRIRVAPATAVDEAPTPTPAPAPAPPAPRRAPAPPVAPARSADDDARAGSKDAQLAAIAHLLGKVPDGEIARRAAVSVRTVASYRARHGIPGYDGPRRRPSVRGRRASRVDDFKPLLGIVPDRVIADIAGMSLGAIRNFRIKQGIEAAGRMNDAEIEVQLEAWRSGVPAPAPAASAPDAAPAPAVRTQGDGRFAWHVHLDAEAFVVVAPDLAAALARVLEVAGTDRAVARIERLGPVLA